MSHTAAHALAAAPVPVEEQPLPEHTGTVRQVFAAIHRVTSDMAKEGVGKNQHNSQQNFKYRGVDDVMDALAPSLARHGLLIIPRVTAREVTERESRGGGKLFHTILRIEYDFICAADGSVCLVGPIYGEAMDSGDKATNKCMAAAYKYACTQTFCIPFSGDDPDAESHEVAGAQARAETGRPPEPRSPAPAPAAAPARPAPEVPTGSDGKPRVMRKGGNFGYGKKFAETPWEVMTTRDLRWFLGAERTPEAVRQHIAVELAWREYEASQLDAAKARTRAEHEASIASDDIPFDP